MKKQLLTAFVLIIISASVKAQIPNNDFECWDSVPGTPPYPYYEEPCEWTSYNPSSQFGYPVFVYKTTDSHTGTYAMEVRTMGFTNPLPPYNQLVEVGLAQTGADYQNGPNGFRDSVRHAVFSAWVKYAPQGVDSAEIKIKLTRWSNSLGQPQDVATGVVYVKTNDTQYHCVTGTFLYHAPFVTSGNPDTASVFVSSSHQNDTIPGDIIKIDDIEFGICGVGMSDITDNSTRPHFYPNPATDIISFSFLPAGADRIKIFETTGKMVAVEAVSGSGTGVDVKRLTPGIYFYGVYDENNKVVSSGKFSIIR